ncbi:Ig-like domain-containing protein [Rahnella woolbedingensis]|uniref:HYR domain-containing protein n=1 Tax=Rahnella woolbedingensis TaxID=1510574 RepID=A0A419N2K7_9GAMM|nr:Ig-like domain-containing protein [Rahnella woolbedingensis]RJT34225.1 hypothetical protein D6C13_23645 [Rahnella woolbedingensis]
MAGPFLPFGNRIITATATDAAGNTSEPSDSFVVNFVDTNQDDITPPDQPTIDSFLDDAGNSISGATTDDATPTLQGHAEANSIVNVYEGDTLLGSTTAKADGTWSYTTPERADGMHDFTVTATDAAGNISVPSADFVVDVETADITPPDAPVILDAFGTDNAEIANGGTTDDDRPQLSGSAEPESIVNIYDGTILLGSAITGSNGVWNYEVSGELSDGKHTLSVTATDAAGNTSTHSADFVLNVVPDHTPPGRPAVTGVYDDVGSQQGQVDYRDKTDDSRPLISGTAEAKSTVQVCLTGPNGGVHILGTVITDSSGHWYYQMKSAEEFNVKGFWKIDVQATDAAGHTSLWSEKYVVEFVGSNQDDTTAPDAPVITDYYADMGEPQGHFNDGTITGDNTPTLNGQAEANSIVKVYEGDTLLGSTTAHSDGSWSYTTPACADGKHDFTATATDAAGNSSAASSDFVVNIHATSIIDVTTPDGLTVSDDQGLYQGALDNGAFTDDTQPEFSGKNQLAGEIITVMDHGQVIGSALVEGDGTWSLTPDVALTEGEHDITLTATTDTGHTGPVSDVFTFTVDTTAPDAPDFTANVTEGERTTNHSPTLTGNGEEAGALITVYDGTKVLGSVVADNSGNWSYKTPTLNNGAHGLSVTATDAAGNVSDASDQYAITTYTDTPPPVFTPNIRCIYEGQHADYSHIIKNDGTMTVEKYTLLAFLHQGATATLYDNGHAVSSDPSIYSASPGHDNYTFDVSSISAGSHTFTVKETFEGKTTTTAEFHVTASYAATSVQHEDISVSEDLLVDPNHHDTSHVSLPELSATTMATLNHHATIDLHDGVSQTLELKLEDSLSHAQQDLFIQDGKQQLAVTGDQGDVVELKVEDLAHNTWQDTGAVTAGGIQYEVYQHTGSDVELLVQHGLELHQVS